MAKEAKLKEDCIVVVEGNVDRTIVVYAQKVTLTLHKHLPWGDWLLEEGYRKMPQTTFLIANNVWFHSEWEEIMAMWGHLWESWSGMEGFEV